MAASIVWTGATDSVFSTVTNWQGGVAPATGEIAVIPSDATVNITGEDYTAAVNLAGFVVERGCTIDIGSVALPLIIKTAAAGEISLAGTGEIHLEVDGDLSGGKCNIYDAGGSHDLHIASEYHATPIELTDDFVIHKGASGNIYLAWASQDQAEVDNIYHAGSAALWIGDGVTDTAATPAAIAKLYASAGTVYCASATALMENNGSTIYQLGGALTLASLKNNAGTTYFNAIGGIVTLAHIYGGLLTLKENAGGQDSAIMSNVHVYGKGQYTDPGGVSKIIGSVVHCHGKAQEDGKIIFGPDRKITTAAL